MKKALALLLSFVIVLTFAGCSFKYNVFQNIEQKSKRFKDVNLSFDSIKVFKENDEHGFTIISAAGEDFLMLVYYDNEEYKTSICPKILSLSCLSLKNITSNNDEQIFLTACKSILLIDEWGLTIGDLKDLEKSDKINIETKSGEKLEIRIDRDLGKLSVYTEEALKRY